MKQESLPPPPLPSVQDADKFPIGLRDDQHVRSWVALGLAVGSVLLCGGFVLAYPARAMARRILDDESGFGSETSRTLARWAMRLGAAGYAVWPTIPILLSIMAPGCRFSPERAKQARVKADMRSMATALEAYRADHGQYPACTFIAAESAIPATTGKSRPTFRVAASGILATMTTPVAYLTGYPHDAFSRQRPPATFAYYTRNDSWIMWSPGPDGDYDTDWKTLDLAVPLPSEHVLTKLTYDPTNGSLSDGDIWRVKE